MQRLSIQDVPQKQEVVMTAYFCGTGLEVTNEYMFTSYLFNQTQADNDNQIKLGFDGTGVTDGIPGLLFGEGIEDQCLVVREQVLDLIKRNKRVKLNCCGYSRGAVAAMILAKKLGSFDPELIEVNLALLDPVPGNWLFTPKIDFLKITLANQAMDLSQTKNLKNVLALYCNQELPSYAAHGPLFGKYPSNTKVEQTVVPGDHGTILAGNIRSIINRGYGFSPEALVTFLKVQNFLRSCGTVLSFPKGQPAGRLFLRDSSRNRFGTKNILNGNPSSLLEENYIDLNKSLADLYNWMIKKEWSECTKNGHAIVPTVICTEPGKGKLYVNQDHKRIVLGRLDDTNEDCILNIKKEIQPNILADFQSEFIENRATPDLLKNFITQLAQLVSSRRKNDKRIEIFKVLEKELKDQPNYKENEIKNILRAAIVLGLQKDEQDSSWLAASQIGKQLLASLKSPTYCILARLLFGNGFNKIRYRDLRQLVLGENDEKYFSQSNQLKNYSLFKDNLVWKYNDQATFLTNVLPEEKDVETELFNAIKAAQGHYNVQRNVAKIKNKVLKDMRAGCLSSEAAKKFATQVLELTTKIGTSKLTLKAINDFEKEIAQYINTTRQDWKIILSTFIGAMVGALIGFALGFYLGPGAIAAAIIGGAKGAAAGAILGAGGSLGLNALWQRYENQALIALPKETAKTAGLKL